MITGSNQTMSITDKLCLIDSSACIAIGKTSANYCRRITVVGFPEWATVSTRGIPCPSLFHRCVPDA